MSAQGGFATKCVHAGKNPDEFGALCTPIYQTSTFAYPDTDSAAAGFADLASGFHGFAYSRLTNPSCDVFEKKLAELEHGARAVAFASGMGAIAGTLVSLVKAGDHIVCSKTLYSGTHHLINASLARFGVEVTAVNTSDLDAVEKAVRPSTKLIYFETPANPTMEITDIAGIVAIAKKHGLMTVSDNTFASPFLTNPIDFGVDIVVHSCTKYIGGHGDVIAGAAVAKEEDIASLIRYEGLMHFGAVMAPHTAFLLERGLKTLGIRMRQHCANALQIASWLEKQPWVAGVRYPYLPSDPSCETAKRQMRGGSGVVTFDVAAGLEGGKALMNHLKLCTIAVSLGDCETLVEHPASMTHIMVDKEERLAEGITDGLIRMSVGLEDAEDLIADLEQAAAYIGK
ncbi:MAG TPA: aminotransferase class I/II-fold pyridoxal phosphate-dependent enzyme [Terriglobales bacterium]|nr:aminotransferase class I/II-fold pyridoxal phosphate-dependent enzyme [Terriglobales bacterium]